MTISVASVTVEKAEEIEAATVIGAFLTAANDLIIQQRGGTITNIGSFGEVYSATPAVVSLASFDKASEDVLVNDWYNPSTPPAKIADPTGGMLTSAPEGMSWSPDGVYLATCGGAVNPSLVIYKRGGDALVKLTNPATQPAGIATDAKWSPDGQYLAVTHNGSPYVSIYKRAADVLTKLTNPTTLPTGSGRAVSWSPDGTYLAIAHEISPYLTIYKRAGDVFTKLADPAALPPNTSVNVAFASNGLHLIVGHSQSPQLALYKRSGDVFTKQTNPPAPSGSTNWAAATAWSPSGTYLAVGTDAASSTCVVVYKRSGDTLTKLSAVPDQPTTVTDIVWSPDERYFAVTSQTAPYLTVYKRDIDNFLKIPDHTGNVLWSWVQSAAWSPDGSILALGHNPSPAVYLIKSSMGRISGSAVRTTINP